MPSYLNSMTVRAGTHTCDKVITALMIDETINRLFQLIDRKLMLVRVARQSCLIRTVYGTHVQ